MGKIIGLFWSTIFLVIMILGIEFKIQGTKVQKIKLILPRVKHKEYEQLNR